MFRTMMPRGIFLVFLLQLLVSSACAGSLPFSDDRVQVIGSGKAASGTFRAVSPDKREGEISVGFSQLVTTPKRLGMALGGYGTYLFDKNKVRKAEGVHDPLMVSTIALKTGSGTIAISSIDAVGISPAVRERVKRLVETRLGYRPTMILSATHTHAAPDIVGLWGPLPKSGRDPEYMAFLEGRIADSVVGAVRNTRIADIHVSRGILDNRISTNEEDEKAPASPSGSTSETDAEEIAKQTTTLWFTRKGASTLMGTLTIWNAHPTVLDIRNNFLTADYVGAFRRFMTRAHPGAIHMYMNGILACVYPDPSGNVDDPFATTENSGEIYDPDVTREEYERMCFVGHQLFDAVHVDRAFPAKRRFDGCSLKTYEFHERISNPIFKLAIGSGVLEKRTGAPFTLHSQFSLLTLGKAKLLFVPGEISPEAAKKLILAMDMPVEEVSVCGVANDWLGYILTPEQYHDKKFKYFKSLSVSGSILERMIAAYREDAVQVP